MDGQESYGESSRKESCDDPRVRILLSRLVSISHGDLLTLLLLSHRLVGPNGDVEPEKKAAGGDCGEQDKACGGEGGKLDW